MDNLTVHLKVVGREIAGIHLLPNWHTIVLRQEKTGRSVRYVMQPGQKPDRSLRDRLAGDSAYISIPVTNDTQLRHEFHAAVDHVSPGHAFDALFILDFSVYSQEAVALQWADDPVRKVELEIRRVLNGITRAAEWSNLYREIKSDGAIQFFEGEVRSSIDALQPFANSYGIRIDRIRMTLRLSKKDAHPDEKDAELERSIRTTESDKRDKIVKAISEHEVNVLETQNAAELQRIARWGKLRADTAGHVDTALGTIAQNITSGAEFKRNVEIMQGLALGAAAGDSMGHSPRAFSSISNPLPGSELLLNPAGESKLVTTVGLVVTCVDSLTGDLARKRELASKLLHLVAEAWLAKESPSAAMEKYAEEAKQALSQFKLTSEQFMEIGRLTDINGLREMLK